MSDNLCPLHTLSYLTFQKSYVGGTTVISHFKNEETKTQKGKVQDYTANKM